MVWGPQESQRVVLATERCELGEAGQHAAKIAWGTVEDLRHEGLGLRWQTLAQWGRPWCRIMISSKLAKYFS